MTADDPFDKKKRFTLRSLAQRIAIGKRSMAACLLPPEISLTQAGSETYSLFTPRTHLAVAREYFCE